MIDVGVRYSLFTPAYETDGKYRVFDPAHYDPKQAVTVNAPGYIIPGSGNELNGLVNPGEPLEVFEARFRAACQLRLRLEG